MRLTVLTAAAAIAAFQAFAQDRDGYYYPPVSSEERFERELADGAASSRIDRVSFVTQVTNQQFQAPYPPRYAVFAKGADADELIIIALDDQIFASLQRARAVMAQLSAPARMTDFFQRNRVADQATFYDMVKLMGFATLTISDGKSWSHRVDFR